MQSTSKPYTELKTELIAHEWSTLRRLWDRVRAGDESEGAKELDQEFKTRFQADLFSSSGEDWHALNDAEQRVGARLKGPALKAEYEALHGLMKDRGLDKVPSFAQFKLACDYTVEAELHAAYMSLLASLQSDFINKRFERRLRSETATRFSLLGAAALLVTMALNWWFWSMLAGISCAKDGTLGSIHAGANSSLLALSIAAVASAGALGALFSRLMQFQSKLEAVGFQQVTSHYRLDVLLTRCVFGVIGATIFYYIMQSGLIGGDLFPKFDTPSNGGARLPVEFAKLLVWSFLAGFSERLVPDSLTSTEGKARSQG